MANTFELIASSTVGGGGAASIAFSSIPSTFTDLVLKVSVRSSDSSYVQGLFVAFNGSSSSFTYRLLEGDGSTAASYSGSTGRIGPATAALSTASTFSSVETYICNYASSNNKSFSTDAVSESNTSSQVYADLTASLWSNASAISSITLSLQAGNFVQYSTAYLYGVKNA
jgi:hypothetical protein